MILGIDFGYNSVKVVILDKNKIITFGEKKVFDDINRFDPDKIQSSHWVSAFKSLMSELSINLRKINTTVTSINGKKVSLKYLTTLEVEEEELNNILNFEAKKLVPLDGTDPVIDYHIFGQNAKEIDKIDLILVATTQKIIRAHAKIIKDCGLKSVVFDASPISLLNCYKYNYDCPQNSVDVIIDLGCVSSTIIVYGENQEIFTREIPIGGHNITLSIMELKKIDYLNAEEIKIKHGIKNFDSNSDVENESIQIMQRNIISELSDEIRKTLRYYMKSKSGVSYNKFYISGATASMLGLIDSLNSTLNIEFEVLNPLTNLETKNNFDLNKYNTAIGSAIGNNLKQRNLKSNNSALNKENIILKQIDKIKGFLFNEIK